MPPVTQAILQVSQTNTALDVNSHLLRRCLLIDVNPAALCRASYHCDC